MNGVFGGVVWNMVFLCMIGNLRVKVNFFNDWLVDFGEDNVFFVFVCF